MANPIPEFNNLSLRNVYSSFFLSKDLNNFRCLGCRYIDEIFVFSLKAK